MMRDVSATSRGLLCMSKIIPDCCRAAGMASREVISSAAEQHPELTTFTDSLRSEIHARGRVMFAASGADGKSFVSPDAPTGSSPGTCWMAFAGCVQQWRRRHAAAAVRLLPAARGAAIQHSATPIVHREHRDVLSVDALPARDRA